MKLYEFNYTDNQNLSEAEVLQRVEEFLISESRLQGWESGYKFAICSPIEHLPTGEKNYSIEVHGRYLDTDNLSLDEEFNEGSSSEGEGIAARDLSP